MDTGRELEEAMRELEAKLPQLRRLMADSTLPFGVTEEAEAWASSLLQSIRLTDSLASQFRRVLLGEPESKPEVVQEAPFVVFQINPAPAQTEMEAELERVFGVPLETVEEIFAMEDVIQPEPPYEDDGPIGGALIGAYPRPKPPSYSPENARTFEEVAEPARNP